MKIGILWRGMIIIDSRNKNVLVTGISSGIGRAIAQKYINHGYTVCGLDKYADFKDVPYNMYVCDLSQENEVSEAFDKLKEKYETINYVVNCAGIFFDQRRTLIEEMDINEWEHVINNNLTGYMLVTKYAISLLRGAKGDRAIINIASDQAMYPRKKNSAYSVSKAGIVNFSHACAVELINERIRVNAIMPASVRSNFISRLVDNKEELDSIYSRENDKMPLGIIEADEVAELAYFLGSDKAKKITGQSIMMNSGLYI